MLARDLNSAPPLHGPESDSSDYELPLDKDISRLDKNGRSILHRCARRGEEQFCLDILRKAAFTEANLKDASGSRALHYAAKSGLVDVCDILAHHPEADFDPDEDQDGSGRTAVDIAREMGN